MSQKRFIITVKPELDQNAVQKVFAPAKPTMQDAVEIMALEEPIDEEAVLGIDEIHAYFKTMTEDQAESIRKNADVIEVIEDIEVFALNDDRDSCEDETQEYADAYYEGYQQAWADAYGAWGSQQVWPFSLTPTPKPIPFPPIKPKPICPPGTRPVIRCIPIPKPEQPLPWNIEMVRANDVWKRVTGKGVKLAIVDTGIDEDHPDLSVSGGASFVPNISSWDDDNGHGTHCAGIAAAKNNPIGVVGVAPDCLLYAVKVLSATGSGYMSWILAGMGWCVRNGIQVVSMSLGSGVSSPDAPCSVAYQRAAELLVKAGCIVVAAAGNSGRTTNHWVGQPARCPGFVAVAAVDQKKQRADFSSYGPPELEPNSGIEISAPGVSVRSTIPGGGYASKSGTSMACPHVSGAAALLKELRPAWNPMQIRNRLKATAEDLGAPGNDQYYGAGLLNCFKAVYG